MAIFSRHMSNRKLLLASILMLLKCLFQRDEHLCRPVYSSVGIPFLNIVLHEPSLFDAG